MINDGGAERMVRSNKIQWYQIVVAIIMLIIVGTMAVFLYFNAHTDKLADILNSSIYGDGYDLIAAVKENYENVAVYGYEESDTEVYVDFRYYEDVLDDDTDLIALSFEVKSYITEYLNEHPDDAINVKQKKVDIRFPDVHYCNYLEDEDFTFSTDLLYVTYEYSGISASEFANQISKIDEATVLAFNTDADEAVFEDDLDFSGLADVSGLTEIVLDETKLTDEQAEALQEICDELEITWTKNTDSDD